MNTRKKYPKEFKLDAVSLVLDQSYTRIEAAKSLDINSTMLGRWVKEHQRSSDGQAFRGNGKLTPDQAESPPVEGGKPALSALSYPVSREKARKLMKEANVQVKRRKKYKVTTNSHHKQPVLENILEDWRYHLSLDPGGLAVPCCCY